MRRVVPCGLAALAAVVPLSGCRSEALREGGASRPVMVTTIFPITAFTRAVAGDCATVRPLIPAGADPHDIQLRPADLARLPGARALVLNGLGTEAFLGPSFAAAAPAQLRVIDTSRGVEPLDSGGPPAPAPNPHIWLDPRRAIRQVENVRDGLVAADPSCREGYRRNATAFIGELRRLDRELADGLAPYAGRTFVAFHDAFPYFAQRYRLRGVFLVTVPEAEPTPADLRRLGAAVRAEGLRGLLDEPGRAHRSFASLAQDLGLPVRIFDPLETGPSEGPDPARHYLETMRRNGPAVAGVFGG